jgi:hypothetical protein
MSDYDFYIDVLDCDESGEDHKLGVRDGRVELLQHNEEMVAAFTAFGAMEPDCVITAGMFRKPVAAFYQAKEPWEKLVWSNYYADPRHPEIDFCCDDLTHEEIEKLKHASVLKAKKRIKEIDQRIAAAKRVMAEAAPMMFRDQEARKRYAEASESIEFLELAGGAAEHVPGAWDTAIGQIANWEQAAAKVTDLATQIIAALTSYKPRTAKELLAEFKDVLRQSFFESITEWEEFELWEEFEEAAMDLALDTERYYEE